MSETPSAAPDRDVEMVRRALTSSRESVHNEARAALDRIERRLSRPSEYDLFDPEEDE